MGFFSWECNACHHPMLSHWATNEVNDWMQQVTVFMEDGSSFEGRYDGYGRVLDLDDDVKKQLHYELEPMCYHTACWLALEPEKRSEITYKPSDNAADQGFFFDDEHNMGEPK